LILGSRLYGVAARLSGSPGHGSHAVRVGFAGHSDEQIIFLDEVTAETPRQRTKVSFDRAIIHAAGYNCDCCGAHVFREQRAHASISCFSRGDIDMFTIDIGIVCLDARLALEHFCGAQPALERGFNGHADLATVAFGACERHEEHASEHPKHGDWMICYTLLLRFEL